MTDSSHHLVDLLRSLVDHEVQFVVCGGVAAVLHGVERVTMDLDISLELSEPNLQSFLTAMREQHMTPRAPIPAESILDEKVRTAIVEEKGALVFTFIDTENPYKQVDVLLTADRSYDVVVEGAVGIDLGEGYTIKALTIDMLLEMKQSIDAPRDKDLHDISELRRIKQMLDKAHG